jgi:hypothetical protein
VRPSSGLETLLTIHGPGEVNTLSGRRSLFLARVTKAGELIELDRQHMLALVQTDAELSEILMRAFILRRVELVTAGVGDVVLIGSTHSVDTLRIKEFLMRNGHPYSYIDLERDPEVQNLLDSKWIFFGYIFYLILTTLIATTAIFYNYLELTLQKRIRGIKSVLAWINLIGINVGGAAAALTIIYAGLVGSGILDLVVNASTGTTTDLRQNTAIMTEYILPIAVFAGLLIMGVVAGTIVYFATYFQNPLLLGKGSTNHSIQGAKMY